MADESETPEPIQVPTLWVGLDDLPVVSANQFAGQIDGDQILVTLGQVVLPILPGTTPAAQAEAAARLGYIPIKPSARITLTRPRLQELLMVLSGTLANYDQQHEGGL